MNTIKTQKRYLLGGLSLLSLIISFTFLIQVSQNEGFIDIFYFYTIISLLIISNITLLVIILKIFKEVKVKDVEHETNNKGQENIT